MEPILQVSEINVRRGAGQVLNSVSLMVARGEIVALLGSNGAGKSTTLRTISGLHHPDAGEIVFDGTVISTRSVTDIVRLGIAHVPEGRRMFPDLTVAENLEMGGFTRRDMRKTLARITSDFPILHPLLGRLAGSLSGGQQQMVALARGLMSHPRLLLLDEPTLGLAPVMVKEVARMITDLIARTDTSVLLVEQNAALALDLCDRGYVLQEGAVVLEGTAAELRVDPGVKRAYLGV